MGIRDRLTKAWDVLTNPEENRIVQAGYSSSRPMFRNVAVRSTVDSFASAAFNRIAIDASMVDFIHVEVDKETQKEKHIEDSDISKCLGLDANLDQTGRQLIQDLVYSMFDEGVVAVVPIQVGDNITLRVGRILDWFPDAIRVETYNEKIGEKQQIVVPKDSTAILENPLYAIINGPNTTLRRLITKMNQIDQVDAYTSSGQLDLILQLPTALYASKQTKAADARLKEVQEQLTNSTLSMAYIDANEKITQLNRPVSNTLLPQIDKLTEMFYNQLGLTANVLNGTASESEMRAYYSRAIDPIVTAIAEVFTKSFLEPEEKALGQKIVFYRDPFKLVPIEQIPDIIDKTSRNEVMTPNEGRRILGLRPSDDPEADVLKNRNMAAKNEAPAGSVPNPDDEVT